MIFASFRAQYAALLWPFRGTDIDRPQLTGVHVQPAPGRGVIIVATDSKVLGAFHDPDGVTTGPFAFNIASPKLHRSYHSAESTLMLDDTMATTVTGDGKVGVSHPHMTLACEPLDWRRAIGNPAGGGTGAAFYPEQFNRFAFPDGGAVMVYGGSRNDRWLVGSERYPNFIGALMPANLKDWPAFPAWALYPAEAPTLRDLELKYDGKIPPAELARVARG